MDRLVSPDDLKELAPVGYHVALRIGFAFPMEEDNSFPPAWISHYSQQRFMLYDPVIRWVYQNTGYIRWSEIDLEDPRRVVAQAKTFGLRYGVAISHVGENGDSLRSFGSFARADREYSDLEMRVLAAFVSRRHAETAPPSNLTKAELEVLQMIKNGKRIKQIAHELEVSEGAIKQRLKNAKLKLDAKTGPQAAALASQYGLI